MEAFKEIFQAGGHSNSLGRAGEVYEAVKKDPQRVGELFDCITAEDAWVRMRAIDTFEKLVRETPEIAQPYLDPIFTHLTKSTQPSIQWHLAQLFDEVTLSKAQQTAALAWLEERIATEEVDWIVSVNTMKTLLSFHKRGLVASEELKPLFELQTNHRSKSVQKKATLFLHALT